jgi:hypothetical protein
MMARRSSSDLMPELFEDTANQYRKAVGMRAGAKAFEAYHGETMIDVDKE